MGRVVDSTAAGGSITGPWQLQRGGLVIGDGSRFDLKLLTGLASAPAVAASDVKFARRDGAAAGSDYLSPRVATLRVEIVDEADSSLDSKISSLVSSFMPSRSESGLGLQLPGVAGGSTVFLNARVRKRDIRHDLRLANGVATVDFQLLATDPRLYGETLESSLVSAAPDSVPGASFNQTFDLSFGGGVAPGSVTVSNGGNYDAPATYRITGPVTDPAVTNNTTGQAFSLTTTLTAGNYVDIDTATRTVLYNGATNYYSKLDAGSDLFDLVPGANELRLTRTGADAATLTVFHRSTFV